MSHYWAGVGRTAAFWTKVGALSLGIGGGLTAAFLCWAYPAKCRSIANSFLEGVRGVTHANVELSSSHKLHQEERNRCLQTPQISSACSAPPVKEWSPQSGSSTNKCLYCNAKLASSLVVYEGLYSWDVDEKGLTINVCPGHHADAVRDGAAYLHNSSLINPNWPDQENTLLREIHGAIVEALEKRDPEKHPKFTKGANANSVVKHVGGRFEWQFVVVVEKVNWANRETSGVYGQRSTWSMAQAWAEWEKMLPDLDDGTKKDLKEKVAKFEACVQVSAGPHRWALDAQKQCQPPTSEELEGR